MQRLTLLLLGISYFLTLRLLYLIFPALKIAQAGSPGWIRLGEEVTQGVDLLCKSIIPLPCPFLVRVQLNRQPHHPLLEGLGGRDTA